MRLIAPFVLGVVAFAGITVVAAGAGFMPATMPPTAVVAGAVDVAATPSAAEPADPGMAGAAAARTTVAARTRAGRRAGGAPPLAGLAGYRWPLPHGRLTLPFGPTPWGSRIVNGESFHDGIDLATSCGDRIVAAHEGVVVAAGRRFDDAIGWVGDLSAYYRRLDAKKLWSTLPIVVIIDDGNGYRSIYAHFSKAVVKPGQTVRAGALIGYEGQTGRASGCHLHYGLFSTFERAEFAIDPAVVKRMKVPRAEIARVDPLLVLPPRPAKPATPALGVGTSAAPARQGQVAAPVVIGADSAGR